MQNLLKTKNIIFLIVLSVLGLSLYLFLPVFLPIILAFFTALMLEPLVRWLQKTLRLKSRLPAVVLSFSLFLCFIGSLFYLAITKLVKETIKFLYRLPYYIADLNFYIGKLIYKYNKAIADLPPALIYQINKQAKDLQKKGEVLADNAIEILSVSIQGIPNLIVVTLIFLITLFLLSMDLPRLKERFYSHFTTSNAIKVQYMLRRLSNVIVGFFKAQFLVSLVIFVVSYISLLIVVPKKALLMSFVIWIIDLIPIVGSIVILAPWAIFNLLVGDATIGIKLLIIAGILLVLRRTLEPKIMGDHMGLSPLSTLISIYLGFYFLGVVGLFAGPLLVIAYKSAKEAEIIKTDFKI